MMSRRCECCSRGLQTEASGEEALICLRALQRDRMAGWMGRVQLDEDEAQEDQVLAAALCSQQPQATAQRCSTAPRCPRRPRASWLVAETVQPAGAGGDRAPVAGTGEAAPQVLYSVPGPSLQERHGGPAVCPWKGNGAGKGQEQKSPEERRNELGLFSPEAAQERPHRSL